MVPLAGMGLDRATVMASFSFKSAAHTTLSLQTRYFSSQPGRRPLGCTRGPNTGICWTMLSPEGQIEVTYTLLKQCVALSAGQITA